MGFFYSLNQPKHNVMPINLPFYKPASHKILQASFFAIFHSETHGCNPDIKLNMPFTIIKNYTYAYLNSKMSLQLRNSSCDTPFLRHPITHALMHYLIINVSTILFMLIFYLHLLASKSSDKAEFPQHFTRHTLT